MTFKDISLLLLPAAVMLLVGCGGGADNPISEAEDVAEVKVEPSPTKHPPKPEPIKSSAPTLTPTAIVDKIVMELDS